MSYPIDDVPFPSFPFRVDFEVTNYCNMSCTYCSAKPFTNKIPTVEDLIFIFKKTKNEISPFEVLITGGEPFSRPDIIDLLLKAKEIFGSIAIVTNGTLLSRVPLDGLIKLRTDFNDGSLQVSLDSPHPAINDQTRSKTTEVLQGLDILEEQNISFSIGMVMTKYNVNTLEQGLQILFKRYQRLLTVNLLSLHPSVVLGKNYIDLQINRNDLMKVYQAIDRTKQIFQDRKINVRVNKENLHLETVLQKSERALCTAGLFRAGVLADGSVVPCTMLRTKILGNLHNQSWRDIWASAIIRNKELQNNSSIFEQCKYCNVMHEEVQ